MDIADIVDIPDIVHMENIVDIVDTVYITHMVNIVIIVDIVDIAYLVDCWVCQVADIRGIATRLKHHGFLHERNNIPVTPTRQKCRRAEIQDSDPHGELMKDI